MVSAKTMFKKLFVSVAFIGCPKVVIASTGRAGSTMLTYAIADSLIWHRFHLRPNNSIAKLAKILSTGYVERISKLPVGPCLICKTHDLYDRPPDTYIKYIFLYGDPLDSAMSVEKVVSEKGEEWFNLHQYHLKAIGNFSDLYKEDVLNYQGQLESWFAQRERDNVIIIDYDDLWDEKERLSKFLGFDIDLPLRRPRQSKPEKDNINIALFSKMRALKDRLKKQYKMSIWHK